MSNYKNIHIGKLIRQRVTESNIDMSRISNFLKCSDEEIVGMYGDQSLDTEILLKWCKLLEYDFFRIYCQHLILYAPQAAQVEAKTKNTSLPQFRKNIYTKELIDFILDQIKSGEMTTSQVINRYGISKTTLYKWMKKFLD